MLNEKELEKRFGMAKDYYRNILEISENEFRIMVVHALKELKVDLANDEHHHHPVDKETSSIPCRKLPQDHIKGSSYVG